MKLLLLNDDGYRAKGIRALADALSTEHEVVIVAPEIEQSACSHRISINRPVPYRQIQREPYSVYAVDGSPADCARFGIFGLEDSFDFVLSGINHGSNIGLDLVYSGTFAAASEAALLGQKAIALSAPFYRPDSLEIYTPFVNWVKNFISNSAKDLFAASGKTILNINFPCELVEPVLFKETTLEPQHYVHQFSMDDNTFMCKISISVEAQDPDSDYGAILEGAIAYNFHDPA